MGQRLRHAAGIGWRSLPALGRWVRGIAWKIAAVAVVAVAAAAWWQSSRPREITVDVFADSAFRQHHANWQSVVQWRIQETNLIYQPAGVRWKVTAAENDSTDVLRGLDERRATLALNTTSQADVLVILTGLQDGRRTGSAVPFSRTALVVDCPDRPEQANANLLARQLARLFGAPEDAAAADTKDTRRAAFSPQTAHLIRQLREYPFAEGPGALEGAWDRRVLDALVRAGTGASANSVAHAHKIMAGALMDSGQWAAAILHEREALRADPKDAPARWDLAYALARDLRDDEAAAELRQALRLDPDNARTHRALAILLARASRFDQAVAEFSEVARLDPRNPEAYDDLGTAQVRAGNVQAGAREFEKALALDPSFGLAHANLAAVCYLHGDYRGAWREVRKARMSGAEPTPEFVANLRAKMPE